MEDINEIRERYNAASEEAAQSTEEIRSRMADAAEQAKVRSQKFWEDTADLIRENPGASVGIALVAGIAIGALIGGQFGGSSVDEASKAGAKGWENAKSGLSDTLGSLRSLIDEAIQKLQP